jgi:hypothetical protein
MVSPESPEPPYYGPDPATARAAMLAPYARLPIAP